MSHFPALLLLVATTAGCRPAPTAVASAAPPTAVPPGYTRLPGPRAPCAGDDCKLEQSRAVNTAGVARIGLVFHGLDSTIAIETSAGWFVEPHRAAVLALAPRHQPRSRGYDLAATRVEGGALVLRMIDSQSVFYPGQGSAGTSSTRWLERRCVVVEAIVHCTAPVQIAAEDCNTKPGPGVERTCTGGPPPPSA